MFSPERSIRLPFLLLALGVLAVALFSFAMWEYSQDVFSLAKALHWFGHMLGWSMVIVLLFFPEVWLWPLAAWLEKSAPRWMYYSAIWVFVLLCLFGLAFIARTVFVYLAG